MLHHWTRSIPCGLEMGCSAARCGTYIKLPSPYDRLHPRSSPSNLTFNYPFALDITEKYTYTEIRRRTPLVHPHAGCSGGEPWVSRVERGVSGGLKLEGDPERVRSAISSESGARSSESGADPRASPERSSSESGARSRTRIPSTTVARAVQSAAPVRAIRDRVRTPRPECPRRIHE
jgi:hypothetical protein